MRLKNASFLEYWFQKHLLQFVSLFPANSRKVFRKLAQFRLLYHSKSSTLVKTIKQSFCKNRILVIFTLKVISGKATCNVLQPAFLISTISGVRSGTLIGAPALPGRSADQGPTPDPWYRTLKGRAFRFVCTRHPGGGSGKGYARAAGVRPTGGAVGRKRNLTVT